MKKLFTFAGMMAAAAIALTGCQTKEAAPEFSDSFTMEFAMDDTRTANDGMSTLWEENDALCLFEAAAGTSSYTAHKATIAEGAGTKAAKFTVDGTAPTGKTDWYALYPYSDKITTPGAREDGFSYIGHSQGEKQKGYDNMSHLSRSLCPLYGIAKGADGINAGIKMHNLASVIEFEVTNNTSSAFVINSLKLDATEDIVGSYFIDITGNAPVYTPTDAEHAFSSATVQVTKDGDNEVPELAKGKSAKLYMAIKPYTHKSGSTFNITVNVTQGGLDKSAEIKLNPTGNQCKFEAGKIKKVAVNVKSLESATSIQDALEGGKHTVEGATVVMTCFKSFFIKDNTGTMWVYMNQSDLGVAKGDKINITGNVTVSNNAHRFNNTEANPVEITKKGTGTPGNPATWNGSKVKDAYGTTDNTAYVKVTATSTGGGNYAVSGAGDIVLYVQERGTGVDNAPADKEAVLTGYVCGWKDFERKEDGEVVETIKEVLFYAEKIEFEIEQTGAKTIAEVVAQIPTTATGSGSAAAYSADLTGAVVTYVNGNNAYLEDESGAILLYMNNHGLQIGDVVSGEVSGSGYYYNGLPEITSIGTKYTKTTTDNIPQTEITVADLLANYEANFSRRIILTNVTITDGIANGDRSGVLSQGGATINIYAGLNNAGLTLNANAVGDLICFPTTYKGTPQVSFWDNNFFIAK